MAATLKVLAVDQQRNGSNGQRAGLGPHSARKGAVIPATAGPAVRDKIGRVLRSLLDSINDDDVSQVVRVYRQAMKARRTFFKGGVKGGGRWVTEADHKTRIQAANMVAAYAEGLPVQRQIQLRGGFVELGEMLGEMRSSGEAARLLPASAVRELPASASR